MDSFDMNSFFDSEEFNALDNESKETLRRFAKSVAGKSQMEAAAIFMEYRSKLSIEPKKQKALIDALKAGLSSENKKRFELMETLINRGGK